MTRTTIHTCLLVLVVLARGSLPSTLAQTVVPPEAAAALANPTVKSLIKTNDSYPSSAKGEAILKCTAGSSNVQTSNYGSNAFTIENTGQKRIAAVFIDATAAMFSDVVFDNDGTGGDSVAKDLTYDSGGSSVGVISISNYQYLWLKARDSSFNGGAAFDPTKLYNINNLFVNAVSNTNQGNPKAGGGYRGELLLFTDFTSTKKVGFSGDMDPNCVAGLSKSSIDSGANWDVGGVSGAEMIGSVVTVIFGDGTSASSTMAADGSNAGSIAVLMESGFTESAPVLTVNGIGPGGAGTYKTNPAVVVSSDPGNIVRISMVKGFDPVTNTATVASGAISIDALVTARLAAQYPEFPVNNAYSWQHKTVTIPPAGFLDVSSQFNVGSEGMAIAWTAVVVDGVGEPISDTASPIRLVYSSASVPVPPPVARPVAPPIAPPVAPPVAPPIALPVSPPVAPPVATPVARPVAPPVALPVAPPVLSPVSPPVASSGMVLTLFNAATDRPLFPLTNGSIISLAAVGTSLTIVATPPLSSGVGSVLFTYDGALVRTENKAPFSLAGDDELGGGIIDYKSWKHTLGTHSLTAKAYNSRDGAGTVLSTVTISFSVQQ